MPRIPANGEIWVRGAYKRIKGTIGRVQITSVAGVGLKKIIVYKYLFGPKLGKEQSMHASGFIKIYEFLTNAPNIVHTQKGLF